jgi:formylglycine-generating enzyme required for sulfatase activity
MRHYYLWMFICSFLAFSCANTQKKRERSPQKQGQVKKGFTAEEIGKLKDKISIKLDDDVSSIRSLPTAFLQSTMPVYSKYLEDLLKDSKLDPDPEKNVVTFPPSAAERAHLDLLLGWADKDEAAISTESNSLDAATLVGIAHMVHFLNCEKLQQIVGKALRKSARAEVLAQLPELFVISYIDTISADYRRIPPKAFNDEQMPLRNSPFSFMMGEQGQQHQVTLTQPFVLKATEVTEGEWLRLMANNPSYVFPGRPTEEATADCPVQQVSWYDAIAYCNALSRQEGFAPYYLLSNEHGAPGTEGYTFEYTLNPEGKYGYRLPTEAEWEYAARAGSTVERYGEIGIIAWYSVNSGIRTHPVEGKEPNAFGVYDMLGNVDEWTGDWYAKYSADACVDPQGPDAGRGRASRGSSFRSRPDYVRAGLRYNDVQSSRSNDLGFRPARSLHH